MKNKKYLVIALLALAIVTALTAGTLAIYTTTTMWDENNVTAKQYVFVAAKTESYQQSVKMAPTEHQDYPFTVTNKEGKTTAEVPMYYEIKAKVEDLCSNFPGLKVELYKQDNNGNGGGNANGNTKLLATVTSGNLAWGGDNNNTSHFDENKADVHNYFIRLTWESSGTETQNSAQTSHGENGDKAAFSISVTATQDTTPQTAPV